MPPQYAIVMETTTSDPSVKLLNWLSRSLGLSAHEAVIRFNDFAIGLKNQLADGAIINWEGVGTISKGLAGNVKFIPALPLVSERPIPAGKVIREKAEHMVRVGEDEKTAAEMTEMLRKTEVRRSYWWITAVALIILAVMFIGWYFSENGLDISSTGNNTKALPIEPTVTYRQLAS